MEQVVAGGAGSCENEYSSQVLLMDLVEISEGGMSCFSLTEGSQGRAVTTRAVLFRTGRGRAGQGRAGQGSQATPWEEFLLTRPI